MGNPSEAKSDKSKQVAGKEDRLAEATSDETLSDLEADKKSSGAERVETEGVPAPDGTPAPDQGGGRADGSDSGGPM